ncbi:unnamed protein product [Ectocarpus sp. 4 AP-2014]
MEVDSAAEASSRQLEEVLARSKDETLDVGEEEEVAGLPFDAGEGKDSDDEPSPAGRAGLWDPSPGMGGYKRMGMAGCFTMLMKRSKTRASTQGVVVCRVGCEFHLGLWWGADMNTPQVAKGKVCLAHLTPDPDSVGMEHERPRRYENDVSEEDIEQESNLIRLLHFRNLPTIEIHKAFEDTEKRLGRVGKQKVRSMRDAFDTS